MTIASTTTKQIMNGDGVTRSWPFTFRAWENEVRVIVTDAAGIETDVTAASIVTLDPGGDGGTVDYPVPAGHKIVVMRNMDLVQETRLVNVTRFDPAVIENQLDRLIANDQQQQEQIDRALSVGVTSGRDPGAVIDEVFLARDRAEAAATAAAASAAGAAGSATAAAQALADTQAAGVTAQTAIDAAVTAGLSDVNASTALARKWADNPHGSPVELGAYSAKHWAEEAQDVVVSNGPTASPTQKGIVPTGGAAGQVYRTNAAGTAYGWENFPEVTFATTAETVAGTATSKATTPAGVKAAIDAVKQTRGSFKWSMFAPDELAGNEPGWYFMGGQGYAVGSAQANALLSLPAAFRTRWGIINDGTNVYMPTLFYSDGRGYVIRAANGTTRLVGSAELDALQGHSHGNVCIYPGGQLNWGGGPSLPSGATATAGTTDAGYGTPRIATETRMLNIGMTPVMYLGV